MVAIPNSTKSLISNSSPASMRVFTPLDRNEYKTRCESLIPTIYLTFISIIEGVALGLLAQQFFTFSSDSKSHIEDLYVRAPYALSTFLSMVIVTYEYIVLTLVERYSYQLLDTIILFGLGLFQIGPSFFLSDPLWWWATNAVFCAAGVIAFINELYRSKEYAFAEKGIYHMTKRKLQFDVCVSVMAAVW